jgi:transposase
MKQSTRLAAPVQQGQSRGQFWREVIGQFAASGQSVRAFCANRGLSEPSFYSWRRTLAQRDANSSPISSETPAAFVPVHIAGESNSAMEIVLRGERRIRICGPVDRSALAEVVAALESVQ